MIAPLLVLLVFFPAPERVIEAVDLYGVRSVSAQEVRARVGVSAGDVIGSREEWEVIESEAIAKLKDLVGVVDARLQLIGTGDSWVLYVGVTEEGQPAIAYHAAPTENVRLPDAVWQDHHALGLALRDAMRAGEGGDDLSQGHSLVEYEPARVIQERFVRHASEHLDVLRRVLRTAADADQRRAAAQIIGYAADKNTVVGDLLHAAHDADPGTRNNAVRALAAILHLANAKPGLAIDVAGSIFVEMLTSVTWTDRNKAMMVLLELTESPDEDLLALLRSEALPALAEMARWKQEGHALMAYILLGRVGGLAEEEVMLAWAKGERETVIAKVLHSTEGTLRARESDGH